MATHTKDMPLYFFFEKKIKKKYKATLGTSMQGCNDFEAYSPHTLIPTSPVPLVTLVV